MLMVLIGCFIAFMVLGVPIAFAMLLASIVYLLGSSQLNLLILPQQVESGVDSSPLLAIPFLLLAGSLMVQAGVVLRIVRLLRAFIGHARGGLAHCLVIAGAFMAGISGSGTADAAALGSVMIPALREDHYDAPFATALSASAGSLGSVLPPSITMIMYGAIGSVSVGQLYRGSVIPAALIVFALLVSSHIVVMRRNYGTIEKRPTVRVQMRILLYSVFDLALPLIVVGGTLSGFFTPTEAGAVAVLYLLLLGFVLRTLTFAKVARALQETLVTLGAVMLMLATAAVIQYVLALHQAAEMFGAALVALSGSSIAFMLLISLLLLLLSFILEVPAIVILVTPIVVPILPQFGIDPVQFGILMCISMAIGLLVPPIGLAMFVTCAISKVRMDEYARAVVPFLVAIAIVLVLVATIPALTMTLPHMANR
jgi:C4-dicarboxylate transporter DctM subunit